MYYKINNKIGFRGWKNIQYALVDIKNNRFIKKISQKDFEILNNLQGLDTKSMFCQKDEVISRIFKYTFLGILFTDINNSPLDEIQKYKYYDCKYISEVVWAITGKCNYKCRHCSVSAPINKSVELSFNDCQKIINQLKECGIMNVTLIGGEPLIRSDFIEIIKELISNNIHISQIFTNGSLINEKLLNELKSLNINPTFRLSFDGIGVHDIQRGVIGAEKDLISKLELLNQNGYRTIIDMCMNYRNLITLEDTIKLLYEKKVSLVNVTPTCDMGLWVNVDKKEKLSFHTYYDYLLEYLPRFINSNYNISLNIYRIMYISNDRKFIKLIPKSFDGTQKGIEKLSCPSFSNSLNISSNGTVSPCFVIMDSAFIKENMPNLFEQKLYDILNHSKYTECSSVTAKDIINSNKDCLLCEYKYLCGGGCRATALSVSGNFYGSDDANCIFFKNGYYDRFEKIISEVKN